MLKSKINRATVTHTSLDGEDAITIDRELLKRADIWPFERVDVHNIDNGARFSAYVLEGAPLSREIRVGGAAAHLVQPGHRITLCSFAQLEEADLPQYRPRVISMT